MTRSTDGESTSGLMGTTQTDFLFLGNFVKAEKDMKANGRMENSTAKESFRTQADRFDTDCGTTATE